MRRAPMVSEVCSGVLTSEPCLKQLDPSCLWILWDAFKSFFLPGKWPLKSSGLGSHLLVVIKCSAAQPWQREGSLQLSPQLGLGWDGLGSISTRQKKITDNKNNTAPNDLFLCNLASIPTKHRQNPLSKSSWRTDRHKCLTPVCFHLPLSGDTSFISAFIVFHSHHLLRAGAVPGRNFCLFSNLCLFCCCVPELWECSMGHFLREGFSHLNTQPCSLWNVHGHYKQREKDLEKQTLNLPQQSKSLFFFARQF